MNKNIAFIPLDGRPCCYDFVIKLGTIAGYEVQTPPESLFRKFMEEADIELLSSWLEDTIQSIDYLVVSVDMLAYGGFFTSSRFRINEEQALERLAILKKIKSANPQLKIFAFNVISRLSWAVYNDEDLELCNMIVEYHQLQYHINHNYNMVDISRYKTLMNTIPSKYIEEYQAVRKRNHSVNMEMIEWVSDGTFDFLVLSQADASDSGPHRDEQADLIQMIYDKKVLSDVIIYPGADETGQILLSRAVQDIEQTQVTFYPVFSSVCGPQMKGPFEDMPMGKNIGSQVYAAGSILLHSFLSADIQLFVHTHSRVYNTDEYIKNHSYNEKKIFPSPNHISWAFVESVSYHIRQGNMVALADTAFANGCDKSFMQLLLEKVSPPRLQSFAGWNTPGNSLGTAIAHSILRCIYLKKKKRIPNSEKKHSEFLFERFMDDYFYQSIVKPPLHTVLQEQNVRYLLPDEMYEKMNSLIREKLHSLGKTFFKEHFYGHQLAQPYHKYHLSSIDKENIHLPWKRIFEISLDYTLKLSKEPVSGS